MNDDDPDRPDSTPPRPATRASDTSARRLVPTLANAIATVLVVVGIASTWVSVEALDTEAWSAQSEQLISDPDVQDTLATHLVDTLFGRLDVIGDLEGRLPEDVAALAAPLASSLQSSATTGVRRLVASDAVRTIWVEANRRAHGALVAAIDGDGPADAVVVDTRMLHRLAADRVGIPEYLVDDLTDDAVQITVFRSDEIEAVRGVVGVLDTLSWLAFVLAAGLFAVAVAMAPVRRAGLQIVGWCLAGAGSFVLLTRDLVLNRAVDALVDNPANEPAASSAARIVTSLVAQLGWAAVINGLIVVGVTSLLGRHRAAARTRRLVQPLLRGSLVVFLVTTASVVIVVLRLNPGNVFHRTVPAVVTIGLLVGVAVMLRTMPSPWHWPKTNSRPPEGPRAEWG